MYNINITQSHISMLAVTAKSRIRVILEQNLVE